MFHPGYQAYSYQTRGPGAGTAFLNILLADLRLARGQQPDPTAIARLTTWVRSARQQLAQLVDVLPAGTRKQAMIYMITRPDLNSNQSALYCDSYQLFQLLTIGRCDPYSGAGGFNLSLPPGEMIWADAYVSRFYDWYAKTNHSNHLHLRKAP